MESGPGGYSGGYNDSLLNPLSAAFGLRCYRRGSRSVRAARPPRKAGEPSANGRPMVLATRSVDSASTGGAVSIRSANRPAERARTGATLEQDEYRFDHCRHCEERSDEAIQGIVERPTIARIASLRSQ